jgi:hypothetical protein
MFGRNRCKDVETASDHSKQILEPAPSAALRDRLAVELGGVNSAEEATDWAYRGLGAKNGLAAGDAECIDEAFRTNLAIFAIDASAETERPQTQDRAARGEKRLGTHASNFAGEPIPFRGPCGLHSGPFGVLLTVPRRWIYMFGTAHGGGNICGNYLRLQATGAKRGG